MKKEMSFSPRKLILYYKMDLAKHVLNQNRHSIEETAFYCGFSGVTHFSRKFKQEFGLSPSKYRKNVLAVVFQSNNWKIPLSKECFNKLIQLKSEYIWLGKLLIVVIDNLDNEAFSIEILSNKLFMSSSNLNRKVKSLFGFPALRLLRDIRLQYATELLILQNKSITESAAHAGFFDIAHFSRVFKQNFGCPPSRYGDSITLFPFVDLLRNQL